MTIASFYVPGFYLTPVVELVRKQSILPGLNWMEAWDRETFYRAVIIGTQFFRSRARTNSRRAR